MCKTDPSLSQPPPPSLRNEGRGQGWGCRWDEVQEWRGPHGICVQINEVRAGSSHFHFDRVKSKWLYPVSLFSMSAFLYQEAKFFTFLMEIIFFHWVAESRITRLAETLCVTLNKSPSDAYIPTLTIFSCSISPQPGTPPMLGRSRLLRTACLSLQDSSNC